MCIPFFLASSVVNWEWQITTGDVHLSWDQRYSNPFHVNIHALAEVQADADVEQSYDDLLGIRSYLPITHVHGM